MNTCMCEEVTDGWLETQYHPWLHSQQFNEPAQKGSDGLRVHAVDGAFTKVKIAECYFHICAWRWGKQG